jgi:hypothetical protein
MAPTDRLDEYGEEEISYSHWGLKPVQPITGIIYSIMCYIFSVSLHSSECTHRPTSHIKYIIYRKYEGNVYLIKFR